MEQEIVYEKLPKDIAERCAGWGGVPGNPGQPRPPY